jgi:hypothetical protein
MMLLGNKWITHYPYQKSSSPIYPSSKRVENISGMDYPIGRPGGRCHPTLTKKEVAWKDPPTDCIIYMAWKDPSSMVSGLRTMWRYRVPLLGLWILKEEINKYVDKKFIIFSLLLQIKI